MTMLYLTRRAPYAPDFARADRGCGQVGRVGSVMRARRASVGASATGSDAADDLSDAKTVDDVDKVFRRYLKAGNIPGFIASDWWVPVKITGGGHTLEILVCPDYAAVGTSADMLRMGKTSQFFAQEVADKYDAIMPSQKLVDIIEAQASNPKLGFIAVQTASGGADDSVAAVVKANTKAEAAQDAAGYSPRDGKIKLGYRKSYVTRPGMNGDYIAIYGGRWSAAGGRVQPPSGHAHTTGQIRDTPNYSDYSHGIMLVSRKAKLDGEAVDLREDVFGSKDPSIWGLVSYGNEAPSNMRDGRFDPVFPNTGSGSVANFSIGPGESGVSGGGGLSGSGPASTAATGSSWGRAFAVAGAVVVAGAVAWAIV